MRRIFILPLAALLFPLAGCAMLRPSGLPGGVPGAGAYQVPQASKDALRQQEKQAYETAEAMEDESQAKLEKDAQKALKYALGQEGQLPNLPPPQPSSASLKALRAAGIKLRIEPVTNEDGGAVADNYVQLKDSFTDRVRALQPKLVDGTATAAEKREVQSGVKHMMKVTDLQMQVLKISGVALTANTGVQTGGMSNMLKVANMVRTRKMMSMDFNAYDWAQVKRILEREKKTEALAAATIGMLAAYQAVIAKNGDPKAIDLIAEGTLKAFPLQVSVTDDEAKAYVAGLSENAMKQKAKYEGWMRKAYGDAKYERQYKKNIDMMFDQAAKASDQKSIGQIQADTMSGYNADLARCARGEDPGPGSMVGPAKCKAARAQGGGGDDAKVTPLTQRGASNAALDQVGAGIGAAKAAADGDVSGALDGAANLVPGDGPIHSSLAGVAALSKGDPKAAIAAAMNLVPGGSAVKEGLSLAAKLFKFI